MYQVQILFWLHTISRITHGKHPSARTLRSLVESYQNEKTEIFPSPK